MAITLEVEDGIDGNMITKEKYLDDGGVISRLKIDKTQLDPTDALIESCKSIKLYEKVTDYESLCPSRNVKLRLKNYYESSVSYIFQFVF